MHAEFSHQIVNTQGLQLVTSFVRYSLLLQAEYSLHKS